MAAWLLQLATSIRLQTFCFLLSVLAKYVFMFSSDVSSQIPKRIFAYCNTLATLRLVVSVGIFSLTCIVHLYVLSVIFLKYMANSMLVL